MTFYSLHDMAGRVYRLCRDLVEIKERQTCSMLLGYKTTIRHLFRAIASMDKSCSFLRDKFGLPSYFSA